MENLGNRKSEPPPPVMDKDRALEDMMGKLGDFGPYQCRQYALHILSAFMAGIHMLSLVTTNYTPDHRCWVEGVDTSKFSLKSTWNFTTLSVIPKTSEGDFDKCFIIENGTEVACSNWVFDSTYRTSSHSIEWDLVCNKRWMSAITQTSYMLGVLAGVLILGGMADKYGRKVIFCWSGVLQLVFGVAAAFIPSYWPFIVVRFVYGIFGSAGCFITGFVLTMELVGVSKRTRCGIAFMAVFAIGIMVVAGWAAIVESRKTLQIIYGLHSLVLIPHIWLMDESPRWLWAEGKYKESVEIVEKGMKFNRSSLTLDKNALIAIGRADLSKGPSAPTATTADLFKTPHLRNRTLNLCFGWFANAIGYYGLTLTASDLSGNPYTNLCISGFVEIPVYVVVIYYMDRWGRRTFMSVCMLIGGAACIIGQMFERGEVSNAIVITGRLFIAASFAIIYNFSAELFPTVVRNSAMGLCCMCCRVSGSMTPLITLLDSLNPRIPATIFGVVAIVSGLLCLFLPETMNQPMLETLADGENFGKGDTAFRNCCGNNPSRSHTDDNRTEAMRPDDMKRKDLPSRPSSPRNDPDLSPSAPRNDPRAVADSSPPRTK